MRLKRTFALIISLILMFCGNLITASANEISYYRITVEEYRNYTANSPAVMVALAEEVDTDSLRECLFEAVYNGTNVADVSQFGLYLNQNTNIITDLLWDGMPELLGVIGAINYGYYPSTGNVVSVIYEYRYNTPDFKTVYDEFEITANKMVADLKNDKLTNVQKALILHDRIIAKCEYDNAAAAELVEFYKRNGDNAVPPWDEAHNAYGAIVTGNAICQGYTEAYKYLLCKVGIESIVCRSTLLNHIWNILYIDGKPYHVDVTWDDPVYNDAQGNFIQKPLDYIAHNNFLLSSDALIRNGHVYYNEEDGKYYTDYNRTPTSTKYDNYFWKNCHHETILIGGGLYHYNDNNELCEYTTDKSLASSGLADIDGDNEINSVDISYCRKFLINTETATNKQFFATDISGDGVISVQDLVRMKKILLYV